jgi:hypothetical protein
MRRVVRGGGVGRPSCYSRWYGVRCEGCGLLRVVWRRRVLLMCQRCLVEVQWSLFRYGYGSSSSGVVVGLFGCGRRCCFGDDDITDILLTDFSFLVIPPTSIIDGFVSASFTESRQEEAYLMMGEVEYKGWTPWSAICISQSGTNEIHMHVQYLSQSSCDPAPTTQSAL